MPKATLNFDLPEEEDDFRHAREGVYALMLLEQIDQRCRAILKYGTPSEETASLAEEIRQMIYQENRVTML
jgi:hypothetical protein